MKDNINDGKVADISEIQIKEYLIPDVKEGK